MNCGQFSCSAIVDVAERKEHAEDAELSIDGIYIPRKPQRVSSVKKSDISLGCVTHGFPDGVDRLQRFHR